MKMRLPCLIFAALMLGGLSACRAAGPAIASPGPTSVATFVPTSPPPSPTPEDMPLGFRFISSGTGDLPYGSMSEDQAVMRLYNMVAPQNGIADPTKGLFICDGIEEIDAQPCYSIRFGEDIGEKVTFTQQYAVRGDGLVYEYVLATDTHVQLIDALDAAADIYNIGEGAPIVSFTVSYDTIEVVDRIDEKEPVLQTIRYERASDVGLPQYGLYVVDANFDGYLDFRIVLDQGANGVEHAYWLWNYAKREFEPTELFQGLQDAVFDPDLHSIRTFEHISAGENVTSVYWWNGEEPLLMHRVEQLFDRERGLFLIRTTERVESGETQITEEYLTEDELLGRLSED